MINEFPWNFLIFFASLKFIYLIIFKIYSLFNKSLENQRIFFLRIFKNLKKFEKSKQISKSKHSFFISPIGFSFLNKN